MPFKGIAGQDLKGEARDRWREKVRRSKLGSKNPNWKGGVNRYSFDTYGSLHRWIRSKLLRPKLCQNCGLRLAIDCANKSGEYKKETNDWWWLCRRCHMALDGRLSKLAPTTGCFQQCFICGKEHWVILSVRNKGEGKYCSRSCANKGRFLIGG